MNHKMLNSEKYWRQRGDPPLEWKQENNKGDLVDYVKDQINQVIRREKFTDVKKAMDKAMEKILKEYPLLEEENINKFYSDEEPETNQNKEEFDWKDIMDNL